MDKAEEKAEKVKTAEKCAKNKGTIDQAVKTNDKAKPETEGINPPLSAEVPAITPYVSSVTDPSSVPAAAEQNIAPQTRTLPTTQSAPVKTTDMTVPTPAPFMTSPDPSAVVSTPTPAPVKTRRVPPGGHTTAFW